MDSQNTEQLGVGQADAASEQAVLDFDEWLECLARIGCAKYSAEPDWCGEGESLSRCPASCGACGRCCVPGDGCFFEQRYADETRATGNPSLSPFWRSFLPLSPPPAHTGVTLVQALCTRTISLSGSGITAAAAPCGRHERASCSVRSPSRPARTAARCSRRGSTVCLGLGTRGSAATRRACRRRSTPCSGAHQHTSGPSVACLRLIVAAQGDPARGAGDSQGSGA